MFTLKAILISLILCIKPTASHDILLPKIVQDSCLTKVLRDKVKLDETLAITWSDRIDDALKSDILKLFAGTVKLILNDWQVDKANHTELIGRPGTALILASTIKDIVSGISSSQSTNAWNDILKFIVVYLDNSGNGRLQSTDPFLKGLFETSTNLNAFNVRVIYMYDNYGIDEFTSFTYQDGNCGTMVRVRLISECTFGDHRVLNVNNNSENRCTITAAVRPSEPYSFYSNDVGFSKGIDVDIIREFAHWSHFDIVLKAIDEDELKEKYLMFFFVLKC